MSIKETLEKIKPFYTLLLILAFSSVFFALGRLSATKEDKTPISITYESVSQTGSVIQSVQSTSSQTKISATPPTVPSGEVIGSKSGKKYYFPWCGTVKRIKPENQVYFASIEAARAAGFTPGGNCKGLK